MSDKHKTLIWDLPIRIFHWSIVILIVFSWYCIEIEDDLENHFLSGYCILALLLFRLIWGFFGTRHVKFKHMLYKPADIKAYAKTFFARKASAHAGHNPLGSLSAFALLGILGLQVGTGLFATDEDYYFGPFSEIVSSKLANRITEIHHLNFDILTGLIVLHICAIVFYLIYKKDNLITAMLTGRKKLLEGNNNAINSSKLITALLSLIFSATAVYLLVNFV